MFIIRYVYLLSLDCREKIAHFPNNVAASIHEQRGLTYCEDIFVRRWPVKFVFPDSNVYLIPARRGEAKNFRDLSHFSIASFMINQSVLPCP